MITTLSVVGTDTVEIGRFGMGLEDAKKAFLKIAEDVGVKAKKIEGGAGSRIKIDFFAKGDEELQPNLGKLLNKVANVISISGDPPTTYYLDVIEDVKDGGYLRTTQYKD